MKFFLLAAAALHLLCIVPSYAQNELKEKLKLFESNGFRLSSDAEGNSRSTKNICANPGNYVTSIGPCLDSVMLFTVLQKKDKLATFEKDIVPYINEKLLENDMLPVDFSDDEELIYESFIASFKWENALTSVGQYEAFIVKSYKDAAAFHSILLVFSYIKNTYAYLMGQTANDAVALQLDDDLKMYNSVDWRVFAQNPGATLLWLAAAYAWEFKEIDIAVKCIEKL